MIVSIPHFVPRGLFSSFQATRRRVGFSTERADGSPTIVTVEHSIREQASQVDFKVRLGRFQRELCSHHIGPECGQEVEPVLR